MKWLAHSPILALALLLSACGSDDISDRQPVPTATSVALPTVQLPPTMPPQSALAPNPTPSPTAATTAPPANNTPATPPTPRPAATTQPATSSGSGSTIIVSFPFDNAAQARASLLGTARFGPPMDAVDTANPLDLASYPGWQRSYPSLRVVGPTANATPSAISVYRGPLYPGPASAANPKVIAFAVADDKGACRAGVIRGFPAYNEYVELDMSPGACNGQSALAAARR